MLLLGRSSPRRSASQAEDSGIVSLGIGHSGIKERKPDGTNEELQNLRERLTRLEAIRPEPSSVGPGPESSSAGRVDPAEAMQERTARHAGFLDAHNRESQDPKWSASAQHAISARLSELVSGSGGNILAVDCRTTTCVADIEWPSFDAANAGGFRKLAQQAFYEENCYRELWADFATDPKASYSVKLVFNCEAARAGDVPETLPRPPDTPAIR